MIDNNNDMAPSLRQAEHYPPVQPEGVRRICGGKTERRKHGRKEKQYRIATWNVRTLYQTGKLENVIMESERLNLDILGMSETRLTGHGKIKRDRYELIYSGGEDHERGVGILMKKELSVAIEEIIPISDRVLLVKIDTTPKAMNLIQVYAPTCDADDDAVEGFYEDIEKALRRAKHGCPTFVMGDLNAKVGRGNREGGNGGFGLGERNERGSRLVEFAKGRGMVIANTQFQQHPRRLYTWKSPGSRTKNQIDYILINERYKNMIKNCHTYPAADCNTDHVMLVAKCKMNLKINRRGKGNRKVMDLTPLKKKEKAKSFAKKFRERMADLETAGKTSVENEWGRWKTALKDTAKEVIEKRTDARKNQRWMNDEIMQMITERREIRDRDSTEYKTKNKEIRKKCREAKKRWYEEKCKTIEELQKKGKVHEMHREIKYMMKTQKKKRATIPVIENAAGELVSGKNAEERWTNYIEELYQDPHRPEEPVMQETMEQAPEIIMEELECAIKKAKNRKACGADEIPVEMIKCLDGEGKKKLLEFLNRIYKTGELPEDFKTSTYLPIPKKATAKRCSDYRTISLMSHTLKLLLCIVNRRIETKIDRYLSKTQYGFVSNRSTRDAIALLKAVTQRALAVNRAVYVCFVDYEKAFDRVKHDMMIQMLKESNVDREDIQIIEKLYWEQKANVIVGEHVTENTCKIEKGVRQGCPLSPRLFNLYAEIIEKNAGLQRDGFKVNGVKIGSISYADDKVIIAETAQQLQRMVNRLNKESQKYGMKINASKTKVMRIQRHQTNRALKIKVQHEELEQVTSFRYLGTIISEDGRDEKEIWTRIAMARGAFTNLDRILKDSTMPLKLRRQLLKCYVWSIMRYGSETWTISVKVKKKIQAFEMWCYRRMLKISYQEKVTNAKVLEQMRMPGGVLLEDIMRKKEEYIIENIKRDEIFRVAIQGKIVGKPPRGRRRLTMLNGVRLNSYH